MNALWLSCGVGNCKHSNRGLSKVLVFLAINFALLLAGCSESAHHKYMEMHAKHHGNGEKHIEHDTETMPGLKGENASDRESDEIATLFRNFETISREVENLENGIRTVTRSSDADVMQILISHSTGMIDRVKRKDDPKIIIQSPTLNAFFLQGDEIESSIEVSEQGLIITQTSKIPELVQALQTHAAEVTAMSDRGMDAVHEMMESRN